jgi:hypothetical protein
VSRSHRTNARTVVALGCDGAQLPLGHNEVLDVAYGAHTSLNRSRTINEYGSKCDLRAAPNTGPAV